MSLGLRGVVSIGIYLVLVLGPVAVAALFDPVPQARRVLLEFSCAVGFVAFALLAAEFSLVARVRTVSAIFGTDVLARFHRHMGLAAVLFALLHPLVLTGRELSWAQWSPFSGPWGVRSGAWALWSALLLVALALLRRRMRWRYEWWIVVHGVLALVVVTSMLAHVLLMGRYAQHPAVRVTCAGYAALALGILAHQRLVRPLLAWRRPWIVTGNRDEGADVRTLTLCPRGHGGLSFEPGQFVWIGTGATPFDWQQHPMTISSSAELPADGTIQLSIKALGDWSRDVVPRLPAGARVWIDGPFGAFTLDRVPAEGFFLVAGGIGVTPMRSMLLTLRDRGDPRPVRLIYATHDMSRAPFVDELAELGRQRDVRVIHVLESPPSAWDGERGFVTTEMLRRHLPPGHRRWQYFVCGPSPMMDALEDALADLDIPPARIHTERFDVV